MIAAHFFMIVTINFERFRHKKNPLIVRIFTAIAMFFYIGAVIGVMNIVFSNAGKMKVHESYTAAIGPGNYE